MKVYVAAHDTPDYHSRPAPVHSIHLSLHGAIASLYPDGLHYQEAFRETRPGCWTGPDGFGSVRKMEVLP